MIFPAHSHLLFCFSYENVEHNSFARVFSNFSDFHNRNAIYFYNVVCVINLVKHILNYIAESQS